LVEAFNRILISKTSFGDTLATRGFHRGIEVFEEKPDLLPFEEAKLYGHNQPMPWLPTWERSWVQTESPVLRKLRE